MNFMEYVRLLFDILCALEWVFLEYFWFGSWRVVTLFLNGIYEFGGGALSDLGFCCCIIRVNK